MPVDTAQIMDAATKLGQMVAQHPAVTRSRTPPPPCIYWFRLVLLLCVALT